MGVKTALFARRASADLRLWDAQTISLHPTPVRRSCQAHRSGAEHPEVCFKAVTEARHLRAYSGVPLLCALALATKRSISRRVRSRWKVMCPHRGSLIACA